MTTILDHEIRREGGLALRVNGSLLAVGRRPALAELNPALRGVALSDSPVLVQAEPQDANLIIERIHTLGRRSEMPSRTCHTDVDAVVLLDAIHSSGDVKPDALGSWALFNVHWWSETKQKELAGVLEELDEGRLHGRLRHERIPRVVVAMSPELKSSRLIPVLDQRLNYFHISVSEHRGRGGKHASS
ncbi:MAG: hypothetical protein ACFB9M_11955 [Myxococcota bacterium]